MNAALVSVRAAQSELPAPEPVPALPLFVDLDGTLINTDLLVESYIALCKRDPMLALRAPLWLLRGKAYLKEQIAVVIGIDPALLPYHPALLDYLRCQRSRGREINLATASHRRYADAVAEHLGIFDRVLASEGKTNLSGKQKLKSIQAMSPGGFVYAGNDRADLPVWNAAEAAILANVARGLEKRVGRTKHVEACFPVPERKMNAWMRAIRPHQWLKNLLVFLPILPIIKVATGKMMLMSVLAFVAFCLCASSVYLLNDVCDLAADRAHPRKCKRPFASGTISPMQGLLGSAALFVLAFGLTLLLPWRFCGLLGFYWLSTTSYTLVLKRLVLIDVVTLACLYTLRVLGGGLAINISPSFWILAFSVFMFFSLALAKRYAELYSSNAMNVEKANGRGYNVNDLQLIQLMGVATGYISVLVMLLYINSPEIISRYHHVRLLWGVCPLLILWVSRVWLKASRGEMTDDPIVFAARDRVSCYVIVGAAMVVLIALI